MSTQLINSPEDGLFLTRFYGGDARGVCYQITVVDRNLNTAGSYHVQLTRAQVERIIIALVADRLGAKPEGE
jgi:hypothetical protein